MCLCFHDQNSLQPLQISKFKTYMANKIYNLQSNYFVTRRYFENPKI